MVGGDRIELPPNTNPSNRIPVLLAKLLISHRQGAANIAMELNSVYLRTADSRKSPARSMGSPGAHVEQFNAQVAKKDAGDEEAMPPPRMWPAYVILHKLCHIEKHYHEDPSCRLPRQPMSEYWRVSQRINDMAE